MQIHIAKNGQRTGPYSEAQVREMLAAGSIAGTDLAWSEGMSDWKPVSEVLSASAAPVAGTPPVVAAAPGAPLSPAVKAIDPNLAGRGTRLLAILIDMFLAGVCCAPGFIVLAIADDDNDTMKIIGGVLVGIAFIALAIIQIDLLHGEANWKTVLTLLAGLIVIAAFLFVDWRQLLEHKKLRFRFRILKT